MNLSPDMLKAKYLAKARGKYTDSDTIDIDDPGAQVLLSDKGAWVRAWVRIDYSEIREQDDDHG